MSTKPSTSTSDAKLVGAIEALPVKAKNPVDGLLAKAGEAAIAAPPKPPKPPKAAKAPTVRDYSDDKPNRDISEYREPRDGKAFPGKVGAHVSRRDSGVNRYAVLISRPGGCTEAEGRHVNPRGFEYSGSFAGYVATLTGMDVVVVNGRYQVGRMEPTGPVLDEAQRISFFDGLGGQAYLDATVAYIRSNPKYDYSGFKLSDGLALTGSASAKALPASATPVAA